MHNFKTTNKTVLPQVWGRRPPTWGKMVPRCFSPDIDVNMSERKSGTERTKKRKKRELVFFLPPWGATGTAVGLHRLDAT